MRGVLDCNVLVSVARVDGASREVIDRAVRRHEIVLSEPILREYVAVAGRPSQAPYRVTMGFVIEETRRLAFFVEPANVVFGLRNPDDEVNLATAAGGDAVLITGNTRAFTETHYGSVEVWSPRTFPDRTS